MESLYPATLGVVVIMYSTMQKQKPKKASTKGQSHETLFVRNLKSCIKNKELLRANRRGLVPLNDDQDKPTFSQDELHRNRKRSLSYKAIAKKVGIDTSKEDVLAVSRVLESDGSLLSIESISTPYRRSLPSPLWFTWDSELEIIKKSAIPTTSAVMSQNPHIRILKHLGEDAGWLLHTYCFVQNVVHSELRKCFEYASDTSPSGELDRWTNSLPSSLVDQVLKIEKDIADAACQMTKEHISGQGRCRCGAVRSLKFKWKSHPIQYPSFFWGCVKYTSYDRALHDSAKSQGGTVWAIVSEVGMSLLPTDARHLHTKCSTLLGEIEAAKDFVEIDQFNKIYGGPPKSMPAKNFDDVLSSLHDLLTAIDSLILFQKKLRKTILC